MVPEFEEIRHFWKSFHQVRPSILCLYNYHSCQNALLRETTPEERLQVLALHWVRAAYEARRTNARERTAQARGEHEVLQHLQS